MLSETVELRKEGGIYWVDVTFNGKVTKPLAFDTGASSVVLPASLAAAIGLKPGKDDPTVRTQVADGSIVEAKRMTIPSVRVGKFTVQDVVCIVMPADKEDVSPLLGQTFLKNFTHQFSGETGNARPLPGRDTGGREGSRLGRRPRRSSNKKRQAPALKGLRMPTASSEASVSPSPFEPGTSRPGPACAQPGAPDRRRCRTSSRQHYLGTALTASPPARSAPLRRRPYTSARRPTPAPGRANPPSPGFPGPRTRPPYQPPPPAARCAGAQLGARASPTPPGRPSSTSRAAGPPGLPSRPLH